MILDELKLKLKREGEIDWIFKHVGARPCELTERDTIHNSILDAINNGDFTKATVDELWTPIAAHNEIDPWEKHNEQ